MKIPIFSEDNEHGERQYLFDFYCGEVERDRWGRIRYGLTFSFYA